MTSRTLLFPFCLLFLSHAVARAADDAIRLHESCPVGYEYRVSTRVELSGTLVVPAEKDKPAPKPMAIRGDSAIEYDERVLSLTKEGEVGKTARIFQRMDFHRTLGDQEQSSSLRREVQRMIVLRQGHTEVPFSPDGPLTWGEIDLVRTDVFTPALVGLLPSKPVKIGATWSATESVVKELTDQEKIEAGSLECKLERIDAATGRRVARVAFSGTLTGSGEDGRNRQKLEGYFEFDLVSNHIRYLFLKGIHTLLDMNDKEVGRIEGRFVLSRLVGTKNAELSDEKLKAVTQEPNAENTLMLYDNPDLGVKLQHPRRWKVAGVRGNQLILDTPDGAGLLITVEPLNKVPSGTQFLTESRDWLTGQKVKIQRTEPVRSVQATPALEQFALEAEIGGRPTLLDYYVARQSKGGATLAATLPVRDLAELRKEVEKLAKSLVITKK